MPAFHLLECLLGAGGRHDVSAGGSQDHAHQLARVGLVIDDEDAQPVESDGLAIEPAARRLGRNRVRVRGGEGKVDGEDGSAALARALSIDVAAVQLDDVSHDGEAEPEPAVSAADRRLALSESVEDERKELAANALARVADRDPRHRVAALEPDIDAAARRRELDGVGEEVPDHLLQAAVIGRHGAEGRIQTRLQPNAFGIGGRLHRFHRGHDDGDQIDGPDVQAELARDDAGHVEQVFDQLSQEAGVTLDHLRAPAGAGGIERPGSEKAHPSQDGVERRAELVRKRREEFVLGAVGRVELSP